MTRKGVQAALDEAQRFVQRAQALLKSKPQTYQADSHSYAPAPWDGGGEPKLSGAVRRASLDLTRALADMRRAP